MLRTLCGSVRVCTSQRALTGDPYHLSDSVSLTRTVSRQYWRLSKGPLSVWVAISAFPGYLVSTPWPVDPGTAVALLAGTFLTSASAQTMNQIIEKTRDARMTRTKMRPLPSSQLTESQAKLFAISAFIGGTSLLTIGCQSPLAGIIAGTTAMLYAGIYTPMKTISGYNTHIGAVVGSMPVLIGYAAANVSLGSLSPWPLFLVQTLWQFPHFYALAWLHKEDYKRGGYQMFPMHDISGRATSQMCAPYLGALALLPGLSASLQITSWMFAISGLIPLGVWVKLGFFPFRAKPSRDTARNFFLHSLWYILCMYAAFTLHAIETSEHDARKILREKLLSFCLHDYIKNDILIPGDLCPIGTAGHMVTDRLGDEIAQTVA